MLASWLHKGRTVRDQDTRSGERTVGGFTLVELMIVVVVVGVLAAIATTAYSRYIRKARAGEVTRMFAAFKAAEEAYHAELGRYLSTVDFYPTTIKGDPTAIDPAMLPDPWKQLKVKVGSTGLYCQYRAIAGTPSDTPSATMYPTAPESNWYYLEARCDFDGDGTPSVYAQRGDLTEIAKQNEGE